MNLKADIFGKEVVLDLNEMTPELLCLQFVFESPDSLDNFDKLAGS